MKLYDTEDRMLLVLHSQLNIGHIYSRRWGMRYDGWGTATQSSSIPGGLIGIFHWHNPSGLTVALGSTQSLTEMSNQEYFLGGG